MERDHRRRFGLMVMGLAIVSSCGCDSRRLGRITASIRQADGVVLNEGLPHPREEAGAYEREKRRHETKTSAGFDFYPSPLELKPEDARRLSAIFGEPGSFRPVKKKSCGGFQPDYAIAWGTGGNRIEALVCFACEEVKLLSRRVLPVHRDFNDGVFKQVHGILSPYRRKRTVPDPRIR